jgi:hypothetical protein
LGAAGADVIGEGACADQPDRAACLGQVGHLVGGLPEVARHPDRAESEAREHRLEHLVAVGGLHQHAVALGDTELRCQRRGHRVDPAIELPPGPLLLTPDDGDAVGVAPGRLGDQVPEVHDPRGGGSRCAERAHHGSVLMRWSPFRNVQRRWHSPSLL